MGWGDCGIDSKGRPIGYYFEATCDHPGCNEKIHRGLSYACGGMHGNTEGCEGYFCGSHLWLVDGKKYDLCSGQLCLQCYEEYGVGREPQDIRECDYFYSNWRKKWACLVQVGMGFKLFQAKNKRLLRHKIERWKTSYHASFKKSQVDRQGGGE